MNLRAQIKLYESFKNDIPKIHYTITKKKNCLFQLTLQRHDEILFNYFILFKN